MDNEEIYTLQLLLDKRGLQVLHKVVTDAHTHWRGGDPDEQVLLQEFKNTLFRFALEVSYRDK